MASFGPAIAAVLKHEGGLVNHKNDTGGITNYGISIRFLKDVPLEVGDVTHDGVIDANDIRRMTLDDARRIYEVMWWRRYGYGNIDDQTVATKVFDFSVNMGATRAHILLQRALNSLGMNLAEDGKLGPRSLEAINSVKNTQALIQAYSDVAWAFYQAIVARNPTQKVFLRGWKNRAYAINTAGMIR